MQVFSARVRGGAIVPEDGVTLPEGTTVTVIADAETGAFETTPEEERELTAQQEAELAESIAEADRGDVITAAELLERLRR
jgi:hypothetical protein